MKTRQAKSSKEVLQAMLWLFKNRLEHTRPNFYEDYNGKEILPNNIRNNIDTYCSFENGKLNQSVSLIRSACIFGCLHLIDADISLREEAENTMDKVCKTNIIYWNGKLGMTKSKVINMLKRAIKQSI